MVALALIAIATYAVNWWKAKNTDRPTVISGVFSQHAEDTVIISRASFLPFISLLYPRPSARGARISNENIKLEIHYNMPVMTRTLTVVSTLFGRFHCMAWNCDFPTQTELILWHVVTVITAVFFCPPLGFSSSYLMCVGRQELAIKLARLSLPLLPYCILLHG
ncbi:uncharacterized protein BO97DRAFT_82321 [Aspergillus homomorphus CBS 101889]|uniref:Uncharacterized protein n=1 Tax=Aspergillus homomorphus (strain CBS 101889) TaxID=1450537 RepID=A0A395IAR5_ASPHC|nr:hypothetical protein BO97DRAFT_82321 [Aspergillus homomorphus CBS 101889]RAL17055.1 hypothetical protein BO97DRAFT_82321 [Aspergillus homomorphus CBS 101889]